MEGWSSEISVVLGFGALKGKRLCLQMVGLGIMVGSPHNRVTAAFRFSFQVQQAEPVMRGCLGILCILLCCEGGKVDPVSSVRGHGTKFKETLRSRVGRGAVRLGAF